MTPVIVPTHLLVRLCHPCPYVPAMPTDPDRTGALVALPESARLRTFSELDGRADFAEVRLGWNEFGLGLRVVVAKKTRLPHADPDRPRLADGLTLWLDTRDSRGSHRASRYCHQFHFTAAGRTDLSGPSVIQAKINRALQDAPLCNPADVPLRGLIQPTGYIIEAFLPAAVLTGFDPDQHPRLGVYYTVRDQERGDQFLTLNGEFPVTDDPSLWSALELVR